ILRANVAHPAGNHDRLVITPDSIIYHLLVGPKISGQVRPAELVGKAGAADRAVDHDVEGRGDPVGFAVRLFPRLDKIWHLQIRYREATQSHLSFRSTPGRGLVANLAANAGCGAWHRRNGCRMIMCLNLDDGVYR